MMILDTVQKQIIATGAWRAFLAIAEHTIRRNGGTFRPVTGVRVVPDSGYTVGVGKIADGIGVHGIGNGFWCDVDALAVVLASVWPKTFPANAQYVGTWIDEGGLYVDHVTVLPTLDVAIACAIRHEEAAVYDNRRREVLFVIDYIDSELVDDYIDGSLYVDYPDGSTRPVVTPADVDREACRRYEALTA